MGFLELVNRRLDHVKAYKSESYYMTYLYLARRWTKKWKNFSVADINQVMVENHILERNKISSNAANKDLRYLRATFNYGIKKKWIKSNPTNGIDFIPGAKKIKYIPPAEDLEKIFSYASSDIRDYLCTINDTMARVNEVNNLQWSDVDFNNRYVVLYTRKKKNGNLTPRKVPMTQRLFEILSRRFKNRSATMPWVFWHSYIDQITGKKISGPYKYRGTILRTLCKQAGVLYFGGFHALRHSGATIMDNNSVPIGSIQRILGHENRNTTEIYLHSLGNSERDAIDVFEKAIQKSHTDSHTAMNSDKKRD